MSSISGSSTVRRKVDHRINTIVPSEISSNEYQRTVSDSQPINESFTVKSYSMNPLGRRAIPVQCVSSYVEYISQCKVHDKCLGHFCITPRGSILLPHKMASTLGVMSNEYAKAAEVLFARDSPGQELEYRTKLRTMMLGKTGKMRGSMVAGPVDSSLRMVISLDWSIGDQEICIPKVVASNMKVLRIKKDDETGLEMGHYIEDFLREGDTMIALRPPSLWAGNVQPMKVVLWNHECIGLNPSRADEFHADHDGDEMQCYFITTKKSIEQCSKWIPLNKCKFLDAVMSCKLPEMLLRMHSSKDGKYVNYKELRKDFMVHSTLSIRELMEGIKLTPLSKASRIKEPMADMLVDKMKNPSRTFGGLYHSSISAIKDIMSQQLSQGRLGDMSRQARLAASCIKYIGDGVFHIMKLNTVFQTISLPMVLVTRDIKYPLGGNSCMRGITALCSKAQQAMLDSHRISRDAAKGLDLIENLIVGSNISLIAVKPGVVPTNLWIYKTPECNYCIIDNSRVVPWAKSIVAAYNPVVLRAIRLINGDVKEVCRKGIIIVCSYYSISITELELHSLVELFTHSSETMGDTITTKRGMINRELRWMTTVFANHYGILSDMQKRGVTVEYVKPSTITERTSLYSFN